MTVSCMSPSHFYYPIKESIVAITDIGKLEGKRLNIDRLLNIEDRDLKEQAKRALIGALQRLNELFIPFFIEKIRVEADMEDPDWRYVAIEIKIDVDAGIFEVAREEIIKSAYSNMGPDESTKVLLIVRSC